MKRRLFLQGIGGAALAAPYLSSLAPKAARAANGMPQRLVVFFTHNGVYLDNYRTAAKDGALSLAGLTTFADLVGMESKMLQVRGLAMFPRGTGITVGGTTVYFDPHDQGTGSKLTAAHNDPTSKWAQGRSFDWFISEKVNPGTDKSPLVVSPTGSGFQDVKTVLSYKVAGDGKAFSPEGNPAKVYSSLTGLFVEGSVTAPATEADYRVLRGNSIMDITRDDLATLKAKNMSAIDKQRIDAWAELLRATEIQVVPGSCNADTALALGISDETIKAAGGTSTTGNTGGFGGGGGGSTELKMTLGMDMLQNLMALTMICDANRVLVQHNQSFVTFNFAGMNHTADHHGISHRTGSAAVGGDTYSPETYIPMIKEIDAFYGSKYARLVKLLDSIPEGDGKLLDNTATIWLPELGDGEAHNNDDLPITIAGSMGGFLKQGVIVDVTPASTGGGGFGGGFSFGSGGTPLNQLYVSFANGLGATDVTEFGEADSNDVDAGITQPGPLSQIHA